MSLLDNDKPKPPTDWEAIEREYRAGQLSVSEIARQHNISHAAILQKAKRKGWERNLADRIKEAVTSKLVTDGLTGVTASETVELAAARGVQIVREHRTTIARGHKIANALFGELENTDEVGLKDKSIVLGNLTGAIKTLVALERQAFNLDSLQDASTTLGELVLQSFKPKE